MTSRERMGQVLEARVSQAEERAAQLEAKTERLTSALKEIAAHVDDCECCSDVIYPAVVALQFEKVWETGEEHAEK